MESLIHEVSSPVVSPRGSAKRLLDPRSAETFALTSKWIERRLTFEGPLQFEEGNASLEPNGGRGRPLNPRGRTGLAGRGLLGKWGPNHAADPIVTRLHPTTNQLQMVAIERADQPGVWALPGGMVDEGETVSETVQREFRAEVGNIPDPEGQRLFEEATGRLFASGGTVVYRGYVDDPRTTDHAWIETTAFHFHCPPEIGAPLASNLGPISPPISPPISV
jgi:ADP-ribose pyrophosphatase